MLKQYIRVSLISYWLLNNVAKLEIDYISLYIFVGGEIRDSINLIYHTKSNEQWNFIKSLWFFRVCLIVFIQGVGSGFYYGR